MVNYNLLKYIIYSGTRGLDYGAGERKRLTAVTRKND